MRYLSLFSGIEAASVAWHPLGWECAAVAEIEPFPCAVLAHHYPNTPNLGDVTRITEADIAALGPIDLVVFGSPCQDLSVAGHRRGLIDDSGNATRSGLFYTAINIVHWARKHCGCRFALWENVPGAFSSNKGRDFASVVEWLAGLDDIGVPPKGWGTEGIALGEEALVEWATLDAQWFGVAQRRRRVFALADFGDWLHRPPILLEPEGLRGDTAPRRETGEGATDCTGNGIAGNLSCKWAKGTGGPAGDEHYNLIVGTDCYNGSITGDVAATLGTPGSSVNASGPTVAVAFQSSQSGVRIGDTHATLDANNGPRRHNGALVCTQGAVAFQPRHYCRERAGGAPSEICHTLSASAALGDSGPHAATAMQVRRLTPRECERLQGFPDDYTQVGYRNKPAADGPRYKALGNSMAVPVMRWIGQQLRASTQQRPLMAQTSAATWSAS